MISVRPTSRTRSRLCRRTGLVAVSEIAVMIVMLASLFWLGSQFMTALTNDAAASNSKGSSERRVYRLSLDDQGQRLWVYRPVDGVVQINVESCRVEKSLPLPGAELSAVAHSRDGSTSLLCSIDGTVALFRDGTEPTIDQFKLTDEMIFDASVSRDGGVAICVTSCGGVICWIDDKIEVRTFKYKLPAGAALVKISVNSAGNRLYVARLDGTVSIHVPETGALQDTILRIKDQLGCESGCTAFAFTEDERLIGVATLAGQVRVFDIATGSVTLCKGSISNRYSSDRPTAIAISPDGRRIAVATNMSADVDIWALDSGEPAGRLHGHDGIVRAVQFDPNSNRLYTGSYDGTIREWQLAGCSQLRVVE